MGGEEAGGGGLEGVWEEAGRGGLEGVWEELEGLALDSWEVEAGGL